MRTHMPGRQTFWMCLVQAYLYRTRSAPSIAVAAKHHIKASVCRRPQSACVHTYKHTHTHTHIQSDGTRTPPVHHHPVLHRQDQHITPTFFQKALPKNSQTEAVPVLTGSPTHGCCSLAQNKHAQRATARDALKKQAQVPMHAHAQPVATTVGCCSNHGCRRCQCLRNKNNKNTSMYGP